MAVVLVQNCPHCGAENTGFTLDGQSQWPGESARWRMLFSCNRCHRPVSATGDSNSGHAPDKIPGDVRNRFNNFKVWPADRVPSIPQHLPEAVAKAFLQAESVIRRNGFAESAVAMDRRALEIATKKFAPDLVDKTLQRRIDVLAERYLLTPALRDWAHELRTLGNDALHDEDGVTSEEARGTHELTRYVLTYLFTLPEQVRASREARAG